MVSHTEIKDLDKNTYKIEAGLENSSVAQQGPIFFFTWVMKRYKRVLMCVKTVKTHTVSLVFLCCTIA